MNAPYSWPLEDKAPTYDIVSDLKAMKRNIDHLFGDIGLRTKWRTCCECEGLYPPTALEQEPCFNCSRRPKLF